MKEKIIQELGFVGNVKEVEYALDRRVNYKPEGIVLSSIVQSS